MKRIGEIRANHSTCSRLLAIAGLVGCLCFPSSVFAQSDIDQQLQSLLSQAEDEYFGFAMEQAADTLDLAITVIESQNPGSEVAAQVYLMRGVMEFELTGDEVVVLEFFAGGLSIVEESELNPYYSTPDLEALLTTARENLVAHVEPVEVTLTHTPATLVSAGESIVVSVGVTPENEVDRVRLNFRPYQEERFLRREMDAESAGSYRAEISGSETHGVQLEYYIEALDDEGDILALSGSRGTPHVVIIVDGDGQTSPERIVSMALAVGTGAGAATGEPLVQHARVDLNPGIAMTPLHLYVEAYYRFAEVFEVGPFFRLQTVLLEDGIELEPIIGGKFRWFFSADDNPLMYLSVGGGWGNVRHTVDLAPELDFVDTTREGPGHGGVGYGLVIMFSENLGLLNDIYLMVLFDQISVQLDYNLGLFATF